MNRSEVDVEALKVMKVLAESIRARKEVRLELQTKADEIREQALENNRILGEYERKYFDLAESLIIIDILLEDEEEKGE